MLRATNHAGQFQASVTCHTDTIGGLLKSDTVSVDTLQHGRHGASFALIHRIATSL